MKNIPAIEIEVEVSVYILRLNSVEIVDIATFLEIDVERAKKIAAKWNEHFDFAEYILGKHNVFRSEQIRNKAITELKSLAFSGPLEERRLACLDLIRLSNGDGFIGT